MKILCDREKLTHAFQIAAAVAPSRSPKPILENVKLDVVDGKAVFSATDLEVSIQVTTEGVEVESPGEVVLPKDRVGSILRESSDAQLRIESDDRKTILRGDRAQFKLQTADPAEFPAAPEFASDAYHEINARLFKEMIRRTKFATDAESSRYALAGVLLELTADQAVAVGTDGRRLARMQGPAKGVGGHDTSSDSTIVPSRAMQLMERCLAASLSDGEDVQAKLACDQHGVHLSVGGVLLHSRLAEGRFPRWRDVFPQRTEATKIELAVGPLLSAVRQAAIVTSEESRGIAFRFESGLLKLSGRGKDAGESDVELPIAYDAGALEIHLDPRFVIDFLGVLEPDKSFVLELEGSETAGLFQTDDGYAYVVMPLAADQ